MFVPRRKGKAAKDKETLRSDSLAGDAIAVEVRCDAPDDDGGTTSVAGGGEMAMAAAPGTSGAMSPRALSLLFHMMLHYKLLLPNDYGAFVAWTSPA